ncbi:enoyl-CoA hydratase-related protein [Cypionkella psychrotolerans]|uniref:enoyl-CoA hydratase-related protein n=1 Tax=Cypionkella psychrotolerans TaxID=1678131 RepID=UPI0006B40339|nr:enoyl-CoA hydratase-related protein [Cypionkella psychrotolerans]
MENLIVTQHPFWLHIALNRPAAKNALNTATLAALAHALTQAATDPNIRAVLLSGTEGNFAAGADITEIESKTTLEAATDPRKAHWATIRAFPKPLIAAIDGFALGGGLELALMADLIVLGETAKLGLPETNLGLIPGAGGTQRLLALIGRARASRMILTGEIIDAQTAHQWGIAAYLATGSALPDATTLASKIALRAPLALQAAKAALIAGDEAPRAFALERANFESLMDTTDKAEGICAFRDKRKPSFTGA